MDPGTAKTHSGVDEETFKLAMRQLSAAVSIVTTGTNTENRTGLTATAICSVSAEPPQILVCVNRRATANEQIRICRNFCVNVLSHSQIGIAKHFAGMEGGTQQERFAKAKWNTLETGAPALAGCLVNLDCRLQQEIQSGTHSIFIGEIVAIEVNRGQEPLAFLDGQFLAIQKPRKSVEVPLELDWDWDWN